MAFAIPRQVGGAVVRNRLRRQLRAILDDLARTTTLVPPGHLLVGARPETTGRGYDELRRDVIRLLTSLDHRLHRSAAR